MDARRSHVIRAAIPVVHETLYSEHRTSGLPAIPVVDSLLELDCFSELGGLPGTMRCRCGPYRHRPFGTSPGIRTQMRWPHANATDSLNIAFRRPGNAGGPSPGQPPRMRRLNYEQPTCNI